MIEIDTSPAEGTTFREPIRLTAPGLVLSKVNVLPKGTPSSHVACVEVAPAAFDAVIRECDIGSRSAWRCIERDPLPRKREELLGAFEGVEAAAEFPRPVFTRVLKNRLHSVEKDAVLCEHMIARWNTAEDTGDDGFKVTGDWVWIDDNDVDHVGYDPTSHSDCIQVSRGKHIAISNNRLKNQHPRAGGPSGYTSNACIFIKPTHGEIRTVMVWGNELTGGNFSLYSSAAQGREYDVARDVHVFDNRFHGLWAFGPASLQAFIDERNNRGPDGLLLDLWKEAKAGREAEVRIPREALDPEAFLKGGIIPSRPGRPLV